MVGTPLVGAFIAQAAFWTLLVIGVGSGVLRRAAAAVYVGLWMVGFVGLPRIAWWTAGFVTPWVAVLDIALVFRIFRGDIRLT